jgi:hypothetical protein
MCPEQKAQINKRRRELYAAKTVNNSTREEVETKRDQQKIQYGGERTPSQQSASGLNRHGEPSL